MKKELTEKVLKDGDVVEFVPMTEKYGRAEFIVCATYSRGKFKQLHVYPAQQEDAKHFYTITPAYSPQDWSVSSWTHKGIEEPRAWINWWCKEHKGPACRVYVPKNSTRFQVSVLSNLSLNFDK